ncbi:geranylgeranyl pyrophosphate synthetase [Pseudovirgaria hyperparasitica]|uniref:Geranylgeranyl pyrophosphate synthetase n=1 Tax=Pseudovirgaria hyperparasitica TaxID=470096 RepID=A0A6A6WKA4_9PEZI|nr:geranylgeranyl pyrophosphate synthetase [Pseudovirgaria hyperparasitica]KAF2762592.1 geranylgeranyl pyrophosphate synthetase [Pseudovirgaria hyperparasitica]
MAHENPTSPNAIPPRKSSHGMVAATAPAHPISMAEKPILRPLPEENWISSRRRQTTTLLPPPEDLKDLGNDLIHQTKQPWNVEKEKILLAPYDYLYGHPGKDIRSQLIAAFNKWLKVPPDSLSIITKVVGMLHTASLLVDDVEDFSSLRRGVPVAHNIFGTAQTINSANYIYFVALQELSKLNSPDSLLIYTEELLNLHRGQGMDLYWRDTLTCPTEADYLEMVHNKTGGLFRLAIKLMQAESSVKIECLPLVNTIGLLFQILDDHLNLSTYTSAKGFCEDLTEGKFSFPVIHAMRADPSSLVLISILKQKPTDEDVKKYAVAYMDSMGSFEYSKKCIMELNNKAHTFVEQLESQLGSEGKEGAEGIRHICDKMVEKLQEPVVKV